MPNGHQLPHRDMHDSDHRDPLDEEATERSELDSFKRNPFEPDSKEWFAWRSGWLERKLWGEARQAALVKRAEALAKRKAS